MPEPRVPIDPSAVFVAEDGEVKVFPQYARRAQVYELDRLTSVEERAQTVIPADVVVHTIRYLPLREVVVDVRGRIAVLRLLAEREERDDLLDRAHEALEDLIHCAVGEHFCKPEAFQIAHELADRDWRRKHER